MPSFQPAQPHGEREPTICVGLLVMSLYAITIDTLNAVIIVID